MSELHDLMRGWRKGLSGAERLRRRNTLGDLLQEGACPNVLDRAGRTALGMLDPSDFNPADELCHMIQRLIQHGANPFFGKDTFACMTPAMLHTALEAICKKEDQGLPLRGPDGSTPYHALIEQQGRWWEGMVMASDYKRIKNAWLNTQRVDGKTPLHVVLDTQACAMLAAILGDTTTQISYQRLVVSSQSGKLAHQQNADTLWRHMGKLVERGADLSLMDAKGISVARRIHCLVEQGLPTLEEGSVLAVRVAETLAHETLQAQTPKAPNQPKVRL